MLDKKAKANFSVVLKLRYSKGIVLLSVFSGFFPGIHQKSIQWQMLFNGYQCSGGQFLESSKAIRAQTSATERIQENSFFFA